MKYIFRALLVVLSASLFSAKAQTHRHEFGFQSDNDSFLAQGSDRYYTNGLFIYYRQALPVAAGGKLANKVLGIEIGQYLYNAVSGSVANTTSVDRPFAAYLYAGANLHLLYQNERALKLSVQAGVIGPAALGKQVQQIIHNTFGFYKLNGWQYQIRNSAEVNTAVNYTHLLTRSSWADISAAGYANLGTTFTGAGLGPLLRLGNFNQLYNSVSTESTATQNSATPPLHKHELFIYYKPQLNGVLYDATVQGGLFKNKQANGNEITGQPNRVVVSQQIGLAYAGLRWVLNGSATFHTRDVKSQYYSNHQWGSVGVLYRFN